MLAGGATAAASRWPRHALAVLCRHVPRSLDTMHLERTVFNVRFHAHDALAPNAQRLAMGGTPAHALELSGNNTYSIYGKAFQIVVSVSGTILGPILLIGCNLILLQRGIGRFLPNSNQERPIVLKVIHVPCRRRHAARCSSHWRSFTYLLLISVMCCVCCCFCCSNH